MKWIDANLLYSSKNLTKVQQEVRSAALNNLEAFIKLVAPYQLMAHCHIQMCHWAQEYIDENRLLLWPRDHGKSRHAAFYAAWEIIRDPSTTIIYASATAEKAEEQLRFIKTILDNKITRRYFPGLVYLEEGKTITGKHCKRLILDDIVVPENNTETGRRDVNSWAAQAASIMSADSSMLVVGTRYHPKDAYQIMMDMAYGDPKEDENGEVTVTEVSMFTVMMDNVEMDGEFLWPRQQRKDGKYFGFNPTVLAKKRAVYEATGEITQFYAQYYNDPNDKSTAPIARDLFKYYKKDEVEYVTGLWTIMGRPVWMYAAIDMAAGFRLVAQDLADRLTEMGIRIPIDLYIPPNTEGKFARVNGILEPLYQSGAIYHYRGGNCQVLEDELVSVNPLHDDTKDSWAMCIDLMVKPLQRRHKPSNNVLQFHNRFGGVAA